MLAVAIVRFFFLSLQLSNQKISFFLIVYYNTTLLKSVISNDATILMSVISDALLLMSVICNL